MRSEDEKSAIAAKAAEVAGESNVRNELNVTPGWPPSGDTRDEERRMPNRKHLRGVSNKEQRQYEHIKEKAQKSGRYGKRAKEVAARTVLKQHKRKGHAKSH